MTGEMETGKGRERVQRERGKGTNGEKESRCETGMINMWKTG